MSRCTSSSIGFLYSFFIKFLLYKIFLKTKKCDNRSCRTKNTSAPIVAKQNLLLTRKYMQKKSHMHFYQNKNTYTSGIQKILGFVWHSYYITNFCVCKHKSSKKLYLKSLDISPFICYTVKNNFWKDSLPWTFATVRTVQVDYIWTDNLSITCHLGVRLCFFALK